MAINEEKLNQLLGKFVNDFGATLQAGTIVIGESLGLYKALAEAGEPLSSAQLAEKTGTNERYVHEWVCSQAAGGYVEYDAAGQKYFMTEEQAFTLANEDSPAYMPGAFLLSTSALKAVPKLIEKFRTGEGLGWHEHDHELFRGTEKFFRPGLHACFFITRSRAGVGSASGRSASRRSCQKRRLHAFSTSDGNAVQFDF
jgi:hypothetical protein